MNPSSIKDKIDVASIIKLTELKQVQIVSKSKALSKK